MSREARLAGDLADARHALREAAQRAVLLVALARQGLLTAEMLEEHAGRLEDQCADPDAPIPFALSPLPTLREVPRAGA